MQAEIAELKAAAQATGSTATEAQAEIAELKAKLEKVQKKSGPKKGTKRKVDPRDPKLIMKARVVLEIAKNKLNDSDALKEAEEQHGFTGKMFMDTRKRPPSKDGKERSDFFGGIEDDDFNFGNFKGSHKWMRNKKNRLQNGWPVGLVFGSPLTIERWFTSHKDDRVNQIWKDSLYEAVAAAELEELEEVHEPNPNEPPAKKQKKTIPSSSSSSSSTSPNPQCGSEEGSEKGSESDSESEEEE